MTLAGTGYLKTMTQIEALKHDIAMLTQNLYKAYNKISHLEDQLHEQVQASKKTTPKESQAKAKVAQS